MEEQSLALSFGESLTEEVSSIAVEYAELSIDALAEDGLFKDVPIVSTAMAIYRIGKSIRERHHVAKLISFINEINKGILDEQTRQKYKEKFTSNEKFSKISSPLYPKLALLIFICITFSFSI